MIFRNQKGQVTGSLREGIFRKRVQGSKHQLRKPPAYGMDEHIFKKLPKGTEIRILDIETGLVYKASIDLWSEKGFTQNRGHGLQRFLILEEFETYKAN